MYHCAEGRRFSSAANIATQRPRLTRPVSFIPLGEALGLAHRDPVRLVGVGDAVVLAPPAGLPFLVHVPPLKPEVTQGASDRLRQLFVLGCEERAFVPSGLVGSR